MGVNSQKNRQVKVVSSRQNKQQSGMPMSRLKWLLVFILVAGGIVANTYFAQVAWAVRAAIGILIILAAIGIAFQTTSGQVAFSFIKAARGEVRKVVWPTQQETIQTTLIVVAMVVFSALVLWGVDTFLFWLVGWLAGQRG